MGDFFSNPLFIFPFALISSLSITFFYDYTKTFVFYMIEYLINFHYVLGVSFLINKKLDIKQMSYISSFKSSFSMSIIGLFYFFNLEVSREDSIHYILFFTAYLLSDLLIGTIYYKKSIGFLTGYIHHSVYIIINLLSIYSNVEREYLSFMVLEIPTLLFSLGNFNSFFRRDYLFGFLFFITRICYHIYLTIYYSSNVIIFSASILALSLHFYWFKNWCDKYFKFQISFLLV